MRRKLEITIDLGTDPKHYVLLPEGWDDMTPQQQEDALNEEIEDLIWNRVSGTGRVVEVSER